MKNLDKQKLKYNFFENRGISRYFKVAQPLIPVEGWYWALRPNEAWQPSEALWPSDDQTAQWWPDDIVMAWQLCDGLMAHWQPVGQTIIGCYSWKFTQHNNTRTILNGPVPNKTHLTELNFS